MGTGPAAWLISASAMFWFSRVFMPGLGLSDAAETFRRVGEHRESVHVSVLLQLRRGRFARNGVELLAAAPVLAVLGWLGARVGFLDARIVGLAALGALGVALECAVALCGSKGAGRLAHHVRWRGIQRIASFVAGCSLHLCARYG